MNNKKKIIIAAEIWPPDIGGPATYAKLLAEILTAKGHQVIVMTYSDNTDKESGIMNYELWKVNRKIPLPFRYLLYTWKLFKISKDADVIYAQGPLSAGLPAMWVKKIVGNGLKPFRTKPLKLVVKVVGDQAWERACQFNLTDKLLDDFQTEKTFGKIKKIQKIQKKVLEKADAVITVSNWFKNIIVKWEIEANKIQVIHNSIEKLEIRNKKLEIKEDIILTVGRLTKWKGVKALIEIMPELLKENLNFKLVIVGSGPEAQDLRLKIKDLRLESKVIMVGKLSKEELAKYYQNAIMFVLNSGYENCSHVLLEAASFGLPIIASNIGGNPEFIEDGKTGLLVGYNNKSQLKTAISRVWMNKDLHKNLGNNAKAEITEYSIERMIKQTIGVLFSK